MISEKVQLYSGTACVQAINSEHRLDKPAIPQEEVQIIVEGSAKRGLVLENLHQLGHTTGSVTNKVFEAQCFSSESGKTEDVIVRIGIPGVEHREKLIGIYDKAENEEELGSVKGVVGGWLRKRLANEANLLLLVQEHGVPVPNLVLYDKLEGDRELMIEERVRGERCDELRMPHVSEEDFKRLELQKGKILAQMSNISIKDQYFGPLSETSMKFQNWSEYFNYKVTTTLSLLHAMYDQLTNLTYFKDIAGSEHEWQKKLDCVAQYYQSPAVLKLLQEDNIPTVTHGDYWDGNLMAYKEKGEWVVNVIDFERGDISGKSFDLSQWFAWKAGGKEDDPITASADFLKGYIEAEGEISPEIRKYVTLYGLWSYLDFLVIDCIYGIDRTDESAHEINKLLPQLEKIADDKFEGSLYETIRAGDVDFYFNWLEKNKKDTTIEIGRKSLEELFGKKQGIVIDGLRVPPAPGFENHRNFAETEQLLRQNMRVLREAGVDGVVIETNLDRPHRIFYKDEELLDYYLRIAQIAKEEAGEMKIGLNLILFDIFGSLAVAKAVGLDFAVTDEFIEDLICPPEETHRDESFQFHPRPDLVANFREKIGAQDIFLFAGTHANYYDLVGEIPFSSSVESAQKHGADAIVVGKNQARVVEEAKNFSLPVFVAGGIQEDDFGWIQEKQFNGFAAGSLFESDWSVIDRQKAERIMRQLKKSYE